MLYFLIATGMILIFFGGYLIKKENKEHGEIFQEIMEEQQKDNDGYIKLFALNYEMKDRLLSVEDKLDHILDRMEHVQQSQPNKPEYRATPVRQDSTPDYEAAAIKIREMTDKNMSVEEMAAALNIGKGEVLLIQKLLEK